MNQRAAGRSIRIGRPACLVLGEHDADRDLTVCFASLPIVDAGFSSRSYLRITRYPIAPPGKERIVNTLTVSNQACASFELRFRSLFHEGRGYSFPCDAAGNVDIDALSEGARNNYYFAHSVIGREFATPAVQCRGLH